jgi:hypothetical protein
MAILLSTEKYKEDRGNPMGRIKFAIEYAKRNKRNCKKSNNQNDEKIRNGPFFNSHRI